MASALRNADSAQYHDFKSALKSVRALVDSSLKAQYHSHTPDPLVYMERYLQTLHRTKDMLLEFRTLKATPAEANRQDQDQRELRANQYANKALDDTAAKGRPQGDQERLESANQWADLILCEDYFNFIKMHYLSPLASHVWRFGAISMYSI